MVASNHVRWLFNMFGAPAPLVMLGLFQAGATAPVKRGEILILSGGNWIPLAADTAMVGTIAVAYEEIKDGDRAGYYEIMIPRPGDVFEFDLAVAGATAVGTSLYYSSSEALTVTAGTNVIAKSVGQEHYPAKQGHLSDDASGDSGVTVGSTSKTRVAFKAAVSYYAALQA